MEKQVDTKGTLCIIGSLCCWTLAPIFIHFFSRHLDLWTQNCFRYGCATLFLMPFLLRSIMKGSLDKNIWTMAMIPLVPNLILQCCWGACFYYINPAFGTLLSKTSVLWVLALSLIFFSQERRLIRSKCFWFGLVLCVLGVIGVIVFKEDFSTDRTWIGIILVLITGFFWGAYTITSKMAFHRTDPIDSFAVMSLYSTVVLFILALIFGEPIEMFQVQLRIWVMIIISGIIPIAVSHVMFYCALRRIGATIPSLVLLLQPFTVLMLSAVIFNERLTMKQLLFGCILLAGAAFAVLSQRHLNSE